MHAQLMPASTHMAMNNEQATTRAHITCGCLEHDDSAQRRNRAICDRCNQTLCVVAGTPVGTTCGRSGAAKGCWGELHVQGLEPVSVGRHTHRSPTIAEHHIQHYGLKSASKPAIVSMAVPPCIFWLSSGSSLFSPVLSKTLVQAPLLSHPS